MKACEYVRNSDRCRRELEHEGPHYVRADDGFGVMTVANSEAAKKAIVGEQA
jgi:hypothetical protein